MNRNTGTFSINYTVHQHFCSTCKMYRTHDRNYRVNKSCTNQQIETEIMATILSGFLNHGAEGIHDFGDLWKNGHVHQTSREQGQANFTLKTNKQWPPLELLSHSCWKYECEFIKTLTPLFFSEHRQ